MIKSFISLIFILIVFKNTLFSQPDKFVNNQDPYQWLIGASWVSSGAVLNGGGLFENKFELYPTRLFVDYHIYGPWSIESAFALENLDFDSSSRFSFDIHSKYSLYNLVSKSWITPYLSLGGGITNLNTAFLTGNSFIGVNLILSSNLGLQMQTGIKLSPMSFKQNSYMQHSVGLIYKFYKFEKNQNDFDKKKHKIRRKKIRIKTNDKENET